MLKYRIQKTHDRQEAAPSRFIVCPRVFCGMITTYICLNNTTFGFIDFVKLCCDTQLGLETKFYRGDAKESLQREIEIIRGVQKKKVVCVLDEAHLLDKETIEEFRFLLNYKFDSMSPMALILVGQTELWDEKLSCKPYTAVRQRIDIYCTLPHLDRAETEKYILSHLSYAGSSLDVFSQKAIDEVYRISTGIPRQINRVCEKCLMYSFQQQRRIIDDTTVRYVADHEMLKVKGDGR